MSRLRKITSALAIGLLTGWIAAPLLSRHARPDHADRKNPTLSAAATAPLKDWQAWLDETVSLSGPADAAAFWLGVAGDPKLPSARRDLARDEGYALLPDAAFLSLLPDPRLIALHPENTSILHNDARSRWLPAWWRRLWQSGPASAIGAAGTLPSPYLNAALRGHLSDALARTDPDLGLTWIQSLSDPYNPLSGYIRSVAAHNLDKAKELWAQLPSDGPTPWSRQSAAVARRLAASSLIGEWARSDWQSAMAWAAGNLPRADAQQAIGQMFWFIGPQTSTEILRTAAGIADPAVRSLAYSHTLAAEGNGTAEALVDKALALPANALDPAGWELLGQRSAGMVPLTADPAAAAASLKHLASRVPEDFRPGFITQAAIMAGWNNKPLAGHLLEYLPDWNAGSMAGEWVQQDPMAASTWLTTVPPSAKRDAAVTGFCRALSSLDPRSAADWALTVRDENLRGKTVQDALGAWKLKDPEAAGSWLLENRAAAGLPGE